MSGRTRTPQVSPPAVDEEQCVADAGMGLDDEFGVGGSNSDALAVLAADPNAADPVDDEVRDLKAKLGAAVGTDHYEFIQQANAHIRSSSPEAKKALFEDSDFMRETFWDDRGAFDYLVRVLDPIRTLDLRCCTGPSTA